MKLIKVREMLWFFNCRAQCMPAFPDLNWINVCDADEAWKLLKLGRKNQSFASTHMNENSSRRSGVGGEGAFLRYTVLRSF